MYGVRLASVADLPRRRQLGAAGRRQRIQAQFVIQPQVRWVALLGRAEDSRPLLQLAVVGKGPT